MKKKLGKSTITTNSVSQSTDPFKVGANQTTSLLGRELLTANEIIALKYKTIIFPVFGNPIFRDTYMFSDIYPKYKKIPICDRQTKILKRLTDNYYTVEKLREIMIKRNEEQEKNLTKEIIKSSQRKTENNKRKIIKNMSNENQTTQLLNNIKNWFGSKIINETKIDGVYIIEIAVLLNNVDLIRLKKMVGSDLIIEIGKNVKNKKTIISFWEDKKERVYDI